MNSTTFKRTGLAALALTMSMGMAACGSDDSSSSSSAPKEEKTASAEHTMGDELRPGLRRGPEGG